jgi:hypothetical protein
MEDGVSDFTWCLECCYTAGISKGESVVKKCINRVIRLQRENGALVPIDEKHAVSYNYQRIESFKNV